MTDAFTYAELDEILRGTGRNGAIGISAIDGLIAALVAAPSFVHPDEWIPLIFGGRQPPLHQNSPELRAVKTIFNRYNEVSEILADRPAAYRPIFMADDDGSIVARDWAVGFALGIGLRSEAWGKRILLIPSPSERDSRRGFPRQGEYDSPWQPRGGLPWRQRFAFGRVTTR